MNVHKAVWVLYRLIFTNTEKGVTRDVQFYTTQWRHGLIIPHAEAFVDPPMA